MVVAFEAATNLRPILSENERFGAANRAASTSSAVGAQYGSLTLTGAEATTVD